MHKIDGKPLKWSVKRTVGIMKKIDFQSKYILLPPVLNFLFRFLVGESNEHKSLE